MRGADTKMVLTRQQRQVRYALLFVVVISLLLLHAVNPERLSAFPLPMSCGAVTGLPCLFCGMTRALHFLLNGDVARALYFNWLALPLLALAVATIVTCIAEIACGFRLFSWPAFLRLPGRSLGYVTITICALWVIQVCLAVTQHKNELLNPKGPLYHLLQAVSKVKLGLRDETAIPSS